VQWNALRPSSIPEGWKISNISEGVLACTNRDWWDGRSNYSTLNPIQHISARQTPLHSNIYSISGTSKSAKNVNFDMSPVCTHSCFNRFPFFMLDRCQSNMNLIPSNSLTLKVTQRTAIIKQARNTLHLDLVSAQMESWLGHHLSWPQIFVVFLSPSGKYWESSPLACDCFLSNTLQFISHSIIWCYTVLILKALLNNLPKRTAIFPEPAHKFEQILLNNKVSGSKQNFTDQVSQNITFFICILWNVYVLLLITLSQLLNYYRCTV
jgi:hypothetical protein